MGDAIGFDAEGWVDRHGDGLYRYALLRLGDPDGAADVVQETFLHALRSFNSFAGRSSERTWLVGILKHKIIDQIRATNRRSVREPVTSIRSEFDASGHWRNGPASWVGEPGQLAESREFWETLGSCLSKLPPGLADAFLLRELDGETSADVQERLSITPANLWARLHRARSLLRQCLETSWFGDRTASSPHPRSVQRKAQPCDGSTS